MDYPGMNSLGHGCKKQLSIDCRYVYGGLPKIMHILKKLALIIEPPPVLLITLSAVYIPPR